MRRMARRSGAGWADWRLCPRRARLAARTSASHRALGVPAGEPGLGDLAVAGWVHGGVRFAGGRIYKAAPALARAGVMPGSHDGMARVSAASVSTTWRRPPRARAARCRAAELPRLRADLVSSATS